MGVPDRGTTTLPNRSKVYRSHRQERDLNALELLTRSNTEMNSRAVEQCEVGCCLVVCIDSCFVVVVYCDGLVRLVPLVPLVPLVRLGRLVCCWIL